MYTQEQIIAKLQDLLELARHKTTNTNEAANAMALAQGLMQRYNLDLAEVEKARPDTTPAEEPYNFRARARWRNRLLLVCAKANFCQAIWYGGTAKAIIIGAKLNITAVKLLFEYLEPTLMRLAEEAFTVYVDDPSISYREYERRASPGNKHSWKDYFFHGAIDGLVYRMMEKEKEFKASSASARALVVVNDNALAEYVREKHNPEETPMRRDHKKNEDAWTAGVRAGLQISLNKQLSGTDCSPLPRGNTSRP